ncbi:MAG TPA: MerR family transcriptional regulator [Gemmatimonadales bacterium]|nr:MerR family transcriptional regulator [Gemmatimonadales bacterium]
MSISEKTPETGPEIGHPIAVVAERTGLSRDVLRAWERRYGAVDPSRTAGGQRLYSDSDIERFKLLAAATSRGRSISRVAGYSTAKLVQVIAEDDAASPAPAAVEGSSRVQEAVEGALQAIRILDGERLEGVLRRALAGLGVATVLEEVIPQLMHEVGQRWSAGTMTIAQEHLASAISISTVLDAIRTLRPESTAPRLLAATPAGEAHSVGAALAAGIAALDGWSVTYLGPNLPAKEWADAARSIGAQVVAVSVVAPQEPARVVEELQLLRAALPPSVTVAVGGSGTERMVEAFAIAGVIRCDSLSDLRTLLARVAAR